MFMTRFAFRMHFTIIYSLERYWYLNGKISISIKIYISCVNIIIKIIINNNKIILIKCRENILESIIRYLMLQMNYMIIY